ncbi:class I SAM-dependent methyltransferase [Maritimibacter sp. UBA3975]|uniref:class I SAM-dependent DNA methyltransferase n=1 Tax=Maritimibacter sp. UBA3975 TaxID=1946833 RepID=UPI000C09D44A|nr:class I SAM-dependent methyltransferase [Maritimibacter sp. UBA3975]MAM61903.1 SAM-dependent methyltransferase [Maritimibacter sp.]|tara:strand:- start:4103 stop:4690 length:588 start_codon:yes stop_codon:yes gene_type:complete
MSVDRETIAVYDARAQDYADMVAGVEHPGLDAFLAALPKRAEVLDLGCGTGAMSRRMMDAGLRVDATDASAAMVELARQRDVPARQAVFADLDANGVYDGVWANFSLLHAPRADFPGHLAQVHRALKPGGHFHIGVKLGTGEKRDGIGRFYTYYAEDELDDYLNTAGFTPITRKKGEGRGLDGTKAPWIWVLSHG